MTRKEARALVGGLGKPSKMPGHAYGLSPAMCNVGSMLRKVAGSTCSHCYACKGQYTLDNVIQAHARRLASIERADWPELMARAIPAAERHFRFHDSGDLLGVEHLAQIVAVAKLRPDVKVWLPTRETATVLAYVRAGGRFPRNLRVRLSATMIDGPAVVPPELHAAGVRASAVHTDQPQPGAFGCKAKAHGGRCDTCRACWSAAEVVSYPKH